MFRVVRAIIRIAAIVISTTLLQATWLAGRSVLPRSSGARRLLRKFILKSWAKSLALAVGMRIRVVGEGPKPPFFLVANHLSYLDILVVASQLECVFIAKGEIESWPGMGWLADSIGTIFINRKNFQDIPRVIGLINETLSEGLGVALFPEGTSTMGDRLMPFSPALLEPAARSGYPVSYASITYKTPENEPPAHAVACWWGDMDFVPHLLKLLLVSKFEATIVFGEDAIQADDRKLLARSLWNAVNDHFIPVIEPSLSSTRSGQM